jgi:IclR family transcriptional regulator, acetate operon repressor
MPIGSNGQQTPPIQSLDRGLIILEAVAKSTEPVSLGELTGLLGIDRSSVFRLANTLKRRGFLAYPSGRKDYVLGPSIWRLSRQYDWSNMLIRICHEHLKKLASIINETAHLAVREGAYALFIDHAATNQVISVSGQTGEFIPLYCTAHGKALLSGMDRPELRKLFGGGPFKSYTHQTITSIDQLVRTCAEIEAHGYATDDGEFKDGIRCVAAPIRTDDGTIVASIGISAPQNRFPKERTGEFAQQVGGIASRIGEALAQQVQAAS